MDITTLFGSALLAAIVSAWVSRSIAERGIYVENITKERARWRERIREIASAYASATEQFRAALEIELCSRLNPYDSEDLQLLDCLRNSSGGDAELATRVSLLLKHDWERAKEEAKPVWKRRLNPVRRVSYVEYMRCYQQYRSGNFEAFRTEISRLSEDEFGR